MTSISDLDAIRKIQLENKKKSRSIDKSLLRPTTLNFDSPKQQLELVMNDASSQQSGISEEAAGHVSDDGSYFEPSQDLLEGCSDGDYSESGGEHSSLVSTSISPTSSDLRFVASDTDSCEESYTEQPKHSEISPITPRPRKKRKSAQIAQQRSHAMLTTVVEDMTHFEPSHSSTGDPGGGIEEDPHQREQTLVPQDNVGNDGRVVPDRSVTSGQQGDGHDSRHGATIFARPRPRFGQLDCGETESFHAKRSEFEGQLYGHRGGPGHVEENHGGRHDGRGAALGSSCTHQLSQGGPEADGRATEGNKHDGPGVQHQREGSDVKKVPATKEKKRKKKKDDAPAKEAKKENNKRAKKNGKKEKNATNESKTALKRQDSNIVFPKKMRASDLFTSGLALDEAQADAYEIEFMQNKRARQQRETEEAASSQQQQQQRRNEKENDREEKGNASLDSLGSKMIMEIDGENIVVTDERKLVPLPAPPEDHFRYQDVKFLITKTSSRLLLATYTMLSFNEFTFPGLELKKVNLTSKTTSYRFNVSKQGMAPLLLFLEDWHEKPPKEGTTLCLFNDSYVRYSRAKHSSGAPADYFVVSLMNMKRDHDPPPEIFFNPKENQNMAVLTIAMSNVPHLIHALQKIIPLERRCPRKKPIEDTPDAVKTTIERVEKPNQPVPLGEAGSDIAMSTL